METEDKAGEVEVVKKKRTKKLAVSISQRICGLPQRTVQVCAGAAVHVNHFLG